MHLYSNSVYCAVFIVVIQPSTAVDLPDVGSSPITKKKEAIYQAAMLDPHTASELDIDSIKKMVDDLIEAHGDWMPKYN